MSLATLHSRAQFGIDAPPVTIEAHLTGGLPALAIVGLPETAVREARDRVRSALINSGFEFPARRVTINLAPADLPKEGGRFDLGIALAILAASGQLPADSLHGFEFIGELGLGGELRPVRGVLPVALQAQRGGARLILPQANAAEAALAPDLTAYGAENLLAVCGHLTGAVPLAVAQSAVPSGLADAPDLADVRGQPAARRALEIAAAGGHSLLMLGPPGAGKTMLATRLPGILPPLTQQEALETAAVQSISTGGFDVREWARRPVRAPHHTASAAALAGGGTTPRPGEISLAHNGVLFLDELPEFDRQVLEVLREPLESGHISIARAALQAEFPARFQLVAAMNPCPCGYLGDPAGRCRCTPEQVRRYRGRLSGPLLDRIDLHVELPPVAHELLLAQDHAGGESSTAVRERVQAAQQRQLARAGCLNSRLDAAGLRRHARLTEPQQQFVARAIRALGLSARATHRVLRIARTCADLAGGDALEMPHLAEALQYRLLDRRQNAAC
ncbi:MAG: YifB family Mg chelatase-like AAA ATPase [Pseudomonadota bacterium]